MSDRAERSPATMRLPGGWFEVARRDRLRALAAQAGLLWLAPPLMRLAVRLAPGRRASVERAWGRAARRALGVRLELSGVEHVDPRRSYLVLPLHEGLADPLALLPLPLPLRFVGRSEFASWPLLGRYLGAADHLLIGGADGPGDRRRWLARARAAVAAGESIVVFPQGSVLGIEVGFRPGAVRLARRLRIPILPIVISGTHRVWDHPFGPRLRLRQPVAARVLPPIETTTMTMPALATLTRGLERRMKRLALESGMPVRHYDPERDGRWDAYDFTIDADFPAVAAALPHRVARTAR